jgi:hypothetical protein
MGRNVAIEVPEQFKAAERFPLIAVGGAYGSVFGVGLICLLLPLYGALLWFHVLLVPVAMGLVGLGARFAMQWYQKRLETQLQAAAG